MKHVLKKPRPKNHPLGVKKGQKPFNPRLHNSTSASTSASEDQVYPMHVGYGEQPNFSFLGWKLYENETNSSVDVQ